MAKKPRRIAFDVLFRIEKDNAYSNLTLDGVLPSSGLDTRDKAFVSALVYGVIERKLTLDYQLASCLDKPLKKLLTDITEVQCADGASDNFPSLSVGIAQSAENENSDFTPFS